MSNELWYCCVILWYFPPAFLYCEDVGREDRLGAVDCPGVGPSVGHGRTESVTPKVRLAARQAQNNAAQRVSIGTTRVQFHLQESCLMRNCTEVYNFQKYRIAKFLWTNTNIWNDQTIRSNGEFNSDRRSPSTATFFTKIMHTLFKFIENCNTARALLVGQGKCTLIARGD